MGPFFYSKKDIPANSECFIILSFFIFFFEIPPKATTFFLVWLDKSLNLFIPKKLSFFLNKDDKKTFSTF